MTEPIQTQITYLELRERPRKRVRAPLVQGLALQRLIDPPTHFYRYLYRSVGRPYQWVDRLRLEDDALRTILRDERVEIWVIGVGGCPAGYCELDFNQYPSQEGDDANTAWISYFGLIADFEGRGLAAYLMSECIHRCFDRQVDRICLNTNELDSRRALPFYQKSGFRPVGRKNGMIVPLSDEEIAAFAARDF